MVPRCAKLGRDIAAGALIVTEAGGQCMNLPRATVAGSTPRPASEGVRGRCRPCGLLSGLAQTQATP